MSQDKHVTSIEELTIPDSINPPSHTLYPIGGIPVHVYGIDEATKSLEKSPSSELVVFNLVHPRTRTYEYAQRLAYLILDAYYKARLQNGADLPPAVAATFDLRNHGHRIIADGNSDWREGNATHGQDMVTGIMGTVQDVELVLEFLPAYLPSVLTTSENASLKKVWNIVSGVSQGGHITWKVASHANVNASEEKNWNLLAAVPFIGCPDLSTMLIHRILCQVCELSAADARTLLETKVLNDDKLAFKSTAYLTRAELADRLEAAGIQNVSSKVFPKYWPQHLHDLVAAQDKKTFEHAKENVANIFAINSHDDPLVPSWCTYEFAAEYPKTGRPVSEDPYNKTLYEVFGLGHIVTNGMVDIAIKYILSVVSDRNKQ